ncbi:MAG: hypothetical protein A4S09_16240 [Proteobacteria bacterium SG_bin7]|nr:MAG: hypothetical protein A4S09_16240 [Proteobacteria bacterium SG_bin7]
MFRLIVILALGILSINALAVLPKGGPYLTGGCVDCFNFVAPSVSVPENIASPEIGLIVYDTTYNIFRGYNLSNKFIKLSDDKVNHSITSSTTAVAQEDEILANATSGAITVTLPAAANVVGKEYVIKKTDSSANAVTIDANSSETIDGALAQILKSQNDSIKMVSDGTGWNISSRYKASLAPTIQKFTSGTGTYNTPTGVVWIRVKMVGGGGGGAGSGTANGSAAGNGGNTTFGSSLLVANGGTAGSRGADGGAPGTASLGSGPIGNALSGTYGNPGFTTGGSSSPVSLSGGSGGSSALVR